MRLSPHDPAAINLAQLGLLHRPGRRAATEVGRIHWERTESGAISWSRTLHGGRVSLVIGIAGVAGRPAGRHRFGAHQRLCRRGAFDHLIMYFIDVQLSLPFILLAIALALILGQLAHRS